MEPDPHAASGAHLGPRVLVAGAGAIGSAIAARLSTAGCKVDLLARGAALHAVRTHGLTLTDLEGVWKARVHASDRVADFEPPDLLFTACKSHDLPALAEQVQPLVGAQTLVVPLVNGVPFWFFQKDGRRFEGQVVEAVDPHGRLLDLLPVDRVLGAVVFMTAEVVVPGEVVSRTPHLVMLGELAGGFTPRLQAVCDLVAGAGIEARPLERVRDKLWTKLIANITSNPLSVVTGATLEQIYSQPALVDTVRHVMHEVMLAASCHGARLEIDPIEFLQLGAAMGPVRTSMLQDHERGRRIELAAIGDALLELGARYGLEMPATRALVERARERAAQAPAREHDAN